MRNFDTWLAQMRPSIATYDYYINFEKVVENANKYLQNVIDELSKYR